MKELTAQKPLSGNEALSSTTRTFEMECTHSFDDQDEVGSNQALMSKENSTSDDVANNIHYSLASNRRQRRCQNNIPLVTYVAFHEKLANFTCFLLTKTKFLTWCFCLLLAAISVPFIYFLVTNDGDSILYAWLPVAVTILILRYALPALLCSDGRTWKTIKLANDDFYEPVTGTDSYFYKPRTIRDIHYSNGVWTNQRGQIVKFRGVNLPAKTPSHGHHPDIFYSHKKQVSFIGTPFPLETAHEHFQRLSNYGFNLIRLVVTWEAVMHEGPGHIDYDYLKYLSSLVDVAAKYGLYVIIDPHQDVWSRFTGGDGAPWWTLDAAGFVTDDDSLHQSGSTFLHHLHDTERYPPAKMLWMTNYGKLATATMFTLFFAGDDYAPGVYVNEYYSNLYNNHFQRMNKNDSTQVSMQQFLQGYYLQFIDVVAQAVKYKQNIIGFNSMNEPSNGYVGIEDLTKRTTPMPFGTSLSYLDGMKVGAGETLRCQFYSFPFTFHSTQTINPQGKLAWKSLEHDIWRKLGVYEVDGRNGKLILQRPDHFAMKNGKDYIEEYMVPLFQKIQHVINQQNPKFIVYAEPFIDINNHKSPHAPRTLDPNKFAWAPHWYDGASLIFRKYFEWLALDDEKESPVLTPRLVESTFRRLLRHIKESGNGNLHVVLGETGVPFDMDDAHNYAASTKALDRVMRSIEANDLDFTLWNYFAENNRFYGDHWCGEDLSVRMTDRNRALLTLIRPFPFEISSDFQIIKQSFDPSTKKKLYVLIIKAIDIGGIDHSSSHIVNIYLPHFHYSNPIVNVSHGTLEKYNIEAQLLLWDCSDLNSDDFRNELVLTVENEEV